MEKVYVVMSDSSVVFGVYQCPDRAKVVADVINGINIACGEKHSKADLIVQDYLMDFPQKKENLEDE